MGAPASPSHGMDVAGFGYSQDDLPGLDHGPLDLRRHFGFAAADPGAAPRPMDLEIGSGKGTFLVQQSALEPGVDFLGIEWAKAYWRHAADRARRHGRDNVRLLWADATVFVRNYVADAALRRVHLYFPDPWPKARHHKRRTFRAPFLLELHRVLRPGGEVRVATDHAAYFEWMQDHATQVEDRFGRRPFDRPDSAGRGELVGTNFERKYRREGRPFHAMTLVKR
ncbi:MAG: tRNA (guanosine(46)-N7)-methyltransferase TrmB [Planctomycetota bacterium]